MTKLEQLHETFHGKMKILKPFIYFKIGADEDLRQEAYMTTWQGLLKDSKANNSFLRTRIKWRNCAVFRNGVSIDTIYRKRDNITLVSCQLSNVG